MCVDVEMCDVSNISVRVAFQLNYRDVERKNVFFYFSFLFFSLSVFVGCDWQLALFEVCLCCVRVLKWAERKDNCTSPVL